MSAIEHLNGRQFQERYPPGVHQIPPEHLLSLGDGMYRDPDAVNRLQRHIAKNGIKFPATVVHGPEWNPRSIMMDGQHRALAAQQLGIKVPVRVFGTNEKGSSAREPDEALALRSEYAPNGYR